jgi:hypothetical protein
MFDQKGVFVSAGLKGVPSTGLKFVPFQNTAYLTIYDFSYFRKWTEILGDNKFYLVVVVSRCLHGQVLSK